MACSADPPHAVLPVAANGNLTVHLSNQSFDRDLVDIEVYIDGVLAVAGDFDVGSQHSWYSFRFAVTPGAHTIRAVSHGGAAQSELPIVITDDGYVVVSYWYQPSLRVDPAEEVVISFHEEPVFFD